MKEVARRRQATPAQIALAWVLAQGDLFRVAQSAATRNKIWRQQAFGLPQRIWANWMHCRRPSDRHINFMRSFFEWQKVFPQSPWESLHGDCPLIPASQGELRRHGHQPSL